MTLYAGNGYKPGGGVWADTSDARVKDDIEDYPRGLADVLQLRPRTWTYKASTGRDPTLVHHGLVAQECEDVMPEMVTRSPHSPLAQETGINDLRTVDATALPYALCNAVRELAGLIDGLGARLATLEA
jgi:hypothetical protein